MSTSNKYTVTRVVQAFYKKKADTAAAMAPGDAKEIQEGKQILSLINSNITSKMAPLRGVDNDDLQKAMSYVIIKRENPVLGPGDNINVDGAVHAKDPITFEDRKALESQFVNQVNRIEGALIKKLSIQNGKVLAVENKNA